MTDFIVITSIANPTEAVQAFAKLKDYHVVVVGDKKTPDNWACDNVTYLSVEKQKSLDLRINEELPYNHYCRKMLGYLFAMSSGATSIIDTDDDNIPKINWGFPPFTGKYDVVRGGKGFVNIYALYTDQHIWPRGLPLSLIRRREQYSGEISQQEIRVGVWQGLADEDPDVDAIYRLTSDAPCRFKKREPIVLGADTVSPFNTQNTQFRKELFPLMYLPSYVTFRFTDILRGLIAQPIMWLYGYHLGFLNATVVQRRNPHDYYRDFLSEVPMYQYTEDVVEVVRSAISRGESIGNNLFNSCVALNKKGIVCEQELGLVESWLNDLMRIS